MQRIDGPTVSAALPAPRATGAGTSAPGYFTRGDPIAGTPPTTLDTDWANMIQEELLAPVLAAGLTPDKADHGQLLVALRGLFVAAGGNSGVTVDGGQATIPLPGGYFAKIGTTALGGSSNSLQSSIVFARAFPNGAFFIGGNADGPANGSWHPVVVTFDSLTESGATVAADSANSSQQISGGRSVRWLAVGN